MLLSASNISVASAKLSPLPSARSVIMHSHTLHVSGLILHAARRAGGFSLSSKFHVPLASAKKASPSLSTQNSYGAVLSTSPNEKSPKTMGVEVGSTVPSQLFNS